jgi:hypothetical protein
MTTYLSLILLLVSDGSALSNNLYMDTTQHSYVYADGSNNHYEIGGSPCRIKYLPVKPAQSSTGIYDGGTPFTIMIGEKECAALTQLLDKAIADKSIHDAEGRKKGAGWINNMREAHSLVPGAPIQKEIEAILLAFRKSTHTMKGRVVERAYVNKRGATTDQKEYYFVPSDTGVQEHGLAKEYFIKFMEGVISKNDLLPFVGKEIVLTAVTREGLWDTMNPEQASRIGHYVAVQAIAVGNGQ